MSLETMTKLASTTVGVGGAATIDFTNIPQNYTDLVIKLSTRISNANVWSDIYVRFNNETTGYTDRVVYGSGTAAASLTDTSATGIDIRTSTSANTASTFGNAEVYIPNYTGSNNKVVSVDGVSENNATAAITQLVAGIWSNPSIINSITIVGSGGNFLQHSTATLYGIKNARQTAGNSIKATGGNIVFDGTYVYHVFNSTGAFIPTQPILVDALVIAGGGGGGNNDRFAGAGGAGGLLGFTNQSLLSTTYAVTVGAGGAVTTKGVNSQIGSLTAAQGGGRGIAGATGTDGSGGSGAGGGLGYVGGSGTSGQGNNGGTGNTSLGGGQRTAGGGGGAGAVGGANSATYGGAGGAGSNSYSSWATATGTGVSGYYAGGGGGSAYEYNDGIIDAGSGGIGGGGKGARFGQFNGATTNAVAGTANTGGGGGGGAWPGSSADGAAGGSGLVIIRYKG